MRLFGGARVVGAYVCPRGVFLVLGRRAGDGIEIDRTLEIPVPLENANEAADHVTTVLRTAGVTGGDVVLTVRGFGVVHHGLQMPPASDQMLAPIIEREVRRLEPDLPDPVVGWMSLPSLEVAGHEEAPHRVLLTAAVPASIVKMFDERLAEAGYRLAHFTALPAAMQRLLEDFEQGSDSTALVAPLPDGAFLGFCMSGGLRLIVEPPLPDGVEHDTAALAEEIELGTMFVRQQFQGANVDRIVVVGYDPVLGHNVEAALTERVHVPATKLDIPELSPAALAALGGMVDATSPKPLTLGGASRKRAEARARSLLESLALAAVILLFLVGAWTITQAFRAKQVGDALQTARRDIEQDSFGLTTLRSTAEQRRMARDAVSAVRYAAADKVRLQNLLGEISTTIAPPVRLDSVRLVRAARGWRTIVGGSVTAETNARAVQALHDLYRELPSRLSADSVKLDQLTYSDSTREGSALVHFQLSFGIPSSGVK